MAICAPWSAAKGMKVPLPKRSFAQSIAKWLPAIRRIRSGWSAKPMASQLTAADDADVQQQDRGAGLGADHRVGLHGEVREEVREAESDGGFKHAGARGSGERQGKD